MTLIVAIVLLAALLKICYDQTLTEEELMDELFGVKK